MVCDTTFDLVLANPVAETLVSAVFSNHGNTSNISRTDTIFN